MTEQPLHSSMEELIAQKMATDEAIIDQLRAGVAEAFPDAAQANVIERAVLQLFRVSSDYEELNTHALYMSSVLDALTRILVEDKQIMTADELKVAVNEAHESALSSIDKAQSVMDDLYDQQNKTSEVQTI